MHKLGGHQLLEEVHLTNVDIQSMIYDNKLINNYIGKREPKP